MNKEQEFIIWLGGVLDTLADDDYLKYGGDFTDFVTIPRLTFDRIRERISKELETKNDNQTLLRG